MSCILMLQANLNFSWYVAQRRAILRPCSPDLSNKDKASYPDLRMNIRS